MRSMAMNDRVVIVEKAAEGSYLGRALEGCILTAAGDVEALRSEGLEICQFRLYPRDVHSNPRIRACSSTTPRVTPVWEVLDCSTP
jgi:hypothetical protein